MASFSLFLDLRFRLAGFFDGLGRHYNHIPPSRDVSATSSSRKKSKPTRRESPKIKGKRARWTSSAQKKKHETIEAEDPSLRFLTSVSQSAQRLLSGSLSRARSVRSCLSLRSALAILLRKSKRAQGKREGEEQARRRRARRRRRRRVSFLLKESIFTPSVDLFCEEGIRKNRCASVESKTAPGGSRE